MAKKDSRFHLTDEFNMDDDGDNNVDIDEFFDEEGLDELEEMNKKRKLEDSEDEEDEEEEESEGSESESESNTPHDPTSYEDKDGNDDPIASTNFTSKDSETTKPELKSKKPLSLKSLSKFKSEHDSTGVIYFSRVPPFMKPIKIRQLLSAYGEIGRIYLAPEDSKTAARRKKYRGNKRKNFTEGWVEFMDKRAAKWVAKNLNATKIGGKKRSFYYDDLWNIKYLSGFKWIHLAEQIAYERAVRDQKLRAEMSQARKENKLFIKNVEKAKMLDNIRAKKRAKGLEFVTPPSLEKKAAAVSEAKEKAMVESLMEKKKKTKKINSAESGEEKPSFFNKIF